MGRFENRFAQRERQILDPDRVRVRLFAREHDARHDRRLRDPAIDKLRPGWSGRPLCRAVFATAILFHPSTDTREQREWNDLPQEQIPRIRPAADDDTTAWYGHFDARLKPRPQLVCCNRVVRFGHSFTPCKRVSTVSEFVPTRLFPMLNIFATSSDVN